MTVHGAFLVAGSAAGPVIATAALSFWGGVDAATGTIVDRSHPAHGAGLAGVVLAMPCGRGSSSSSSVLAEAIRRGTAPAAIVLGEADPILAVGALVAHRLYGRTCPVVVVDAAGYGRVAAAAAVRIAADGDRALLCLD